MTAETQLLSHMRREINEIPEAARRLQSPEAQDAIRALAQTLRRTDPQVVITMARGSSDHAATCLQYAIEMTTGVPVSPLGLCVASIHKSPLMLGRAVSLAISQSGKSPDLVHAAHAALDGGAVSVAITNTMASPVAGACAHVMDILAGPENAVAATKSFTNSVLTGLWLLAHWISDRALTSALMDLPERLDAALSVPVTPLTTALIRADRLVVLGRGPSLGLAREVALKAMEVCGIPAMAYSSAEVLHGPSAILKDGYPVLGLHGLTGSGMGATLSQLDRQGALILPDIPGPEPAHPAIPALERLVVAYAALEAASRKRGLNPDRPVNLTKITSTL